MPYELGSGMFGAEARTSLGGLYGRVDTGFGVGRFRLQPAPADPAAPDTGIYGSWLLQLSGGVEFMIPMNPLVFPMRLEAGWRMAQPLATQAERLHTFTFSAEFPF